MIGGLGDDSPETCVPYFVVRLDESWTNLERFLCLFTFDDMTDFTDAGGWSIKDHALHLMAWLEGLNALLDKDSRRERMDIPEAVWATRNRDVVNAVLQARHREISMYDSYPIIRRTFLGFFKRMTKLSNADLQRPFSDFQPGAIIQGPIVEWLKSDSYEHFDLHLQWMRAIATKWVSWYGPGPQ